MKRVAAALACVAASTAHAAGIPTFAVYDVAPHDGPLPSNAHVFALGNGLDAPYNAAHFDVYVDDAGIAVALGDSWALVPAYPYRRWAPVLLGPLPADAGVTLNVVGGPTRSWRTRGEPDDTPPTLVGAAEVDAWWDPGGLSGSACDRNIPSHFEVMLDLPAGDDDGGHVGYVVQEPDGSDAPWEVLVPSASAAVERAIVYLWAPTTAEGTRCFVVAAVDVALNRSEALPPLCASFARSATPPRTICDCRGPSWPGCGPTTDGGSDVDGGAAAGDAGGPGDDDPPIGTEDAGDAAADDPVTTIDAGAVDAGATNDGAAAPGGCACVAQPGAPSRVGAGVLGVLFVAARRRRRRRSMGAVVAALVAVAAAPSVRAAGIGPYTIYDVRPANGGALPTNAFVLGHGGVYGVPSDTTTPTLTVDGQPAAVAFGDTWTFHVGGYANSTFPIHVGTLPPDAGIELHLDGWSTDLHRTWTTTGGPDDVAPTLVGAGTATAWWRPARLDGTNCDRPIGAGFEVELAFPAADDDVGLVGYEVQEDDGAAAPWTIVVVYAPFYDGLVHVGFDAPSDVSGTRCFAARAVDVGGNRSAALGPMCAEFVVGSTGPATCHRWDAGVPPAGDGGGAPTIDAGTVVDGGAASIDGGTSPVDGGEAPDDDDPPDDDEPPDDDPPDDDPPDDDPPPVADAGPARRIGGASACRCTTTLPLDGTAGLVVLVLAGASARRRRRAVGERPRCTSTAAPAALLLVLASSAAQAAGVPTFGVYDVRPRDGDLPLNARIFAYGSGLHDPYNAAAFEVSIADAGTTVALGDTWCLVPSYPGACWAEVSVGALPADAGVALRVATYSSYDVRRTWRTSTVADETPPTLSGPASITATWRPGEISGSACNRYVDAHFDVGLSLPRGDDDVAQLGYVVREVDGAATSWEMLAPADWTAEDRASVYLWAPTNVEGTRCFAVSAVDVAGNESAPLPLLCAPFVVTDEPSSSDCECFNQPSTGECPGDQPDDDPPDDDDPPNDDDPPDDGGPPASEPDAGTAEPADAGDDDGGAGSAARCACIAAARTEGHSVALAAAVVAASLRRRRLTRAR